MPRIGITGANGFLGWHLRAHLYARKDIQVSTADRSTFSDPAKLREFVSSVDGIVHVAGINRGTEEEIRLGNVTPAQSLVDACAAAQVTPHVVFANSIQHERNTAYALAKRASAEILERWSRGSGAPFTNLILPHLFGEGGRPFYNSAVTTFCHQIAKGEEPKIILDADLELIHAQRVCARILTLLESKATGQIRVEGTHLRVSDTIARLKRIAAQYASNIIPDLSTQIDLDLFNTYRSYLYPGQYPVSLALHSDNRGHLFEAVKSLHGGQCFVSTTRPGITRGNHYHRHKLERFLVVQGEAIIRIRKLLTSDVTEYRVSGKDPAYVDMPALHTHNITNTGAGDLVTLFWSHEIFNPSAADTFAESV